MFSLASKQLLSRAAALSTAAAAGYALSGGLPAASSDDATSSLRDFFPTPESLYTRTAELQCAVAGKTNSAFVFIKPHAANSDAVKALVKAHFKKNGIRVTGEGALDAASIDKNMYIDNHYGAIASKAMKLKPSELNVPAKGQAGFSKMFGESWEEALAAGKVFNAKDACEKLGCDGAGLDAKWATLSRGKNLIKFGGGFYCGKVGDIYVMNGFYMSMRGSYTDKSSNGIHYFTVQWPTDSLSWADFRGEVLGATDPATAAEGSARRVIYEQWESLGLPGQPNVGDNGVHASASPFEAMAERANWLGVDPEEDEFAKGMMAAGVSKETMAAWSSDPQATCSGETGSLFDFLEDLDADDCLAQCRTIQ
jgi:nucleoside diphosphate kinase